MEPVSPLGTYHFVCDSNRDYGGSPFSFVRSVLLSTHVKTALWLPSPSEKALSIVSSKKRDRAYIKGMALLSFQLIDQRAGNSSIQGRVSKVASSTEECKSGSIGSEINDLDIRESYCPSHNSECEGPSLKVSFFSRKMANKGELREGNG